ncbi:sensor histidine kinase [Paenibacillus senegalensis]|uniref:sensor histidine kinase n=1 Tax=Paenibacillus senegalensis TaxID=1465766 RepID=UPI000289F7C8|nr:HAMP domain-containing sensor histidine kinase [Paenibacillus senegalensis]
MTLIQRSMLLVLFFLLASAAVISISFVLVVVIVIFSMEIVPALKQVNIKVYQALVLLLVIGCYSYMMGTIIGKPVLAVIGWLKGLSEGKYDRHIYTEQFAFLWNKQQKIKWYYSPFKGIVLRLQELSASLERNRREIVRENEAKEQWLSGVTHDLKTPFSYIKGYLDLMTSRDISLTEDERNQAVHLIKQKADEIEGLIHTFQIEQARPLALKTRRDLVSFLREVTLDAANNPRAACYHFTFKTSAAAYEYYFDPTLLKRVMQNLLINAVLHNPPDSEIAVRLDVKDYVYITVADNGVGIPSAIIQNVFDYRVRGEKKAADGRGIGLGVTKAADGDGIGLAVVKALVEEHQGVIDVQSIANQGTLLTIKLPLVRE